MSEERNKPFSNISTWLNTSNPVPGYLLGGERYRLNQQKRRSPFVTGLIPVIIMLMINNYMCCAQCSLFHQDRDNFNCTL